QHPVLQDGGLEIVMTAYIDAIEQSGAAAEVRIPVGTQYHVNIYQSVGPHFPRSITGASMAGMGSVVKYDLDINGLPCVTWPPLDHGSIDDCVIVHKIIGDHARRAVLPCGNIEIGRASCRKESRCRVVR